MLLSSFLSLIVGTVLGLTQTRIKRLLAYSTISHLGFILLALTVNSLESVQAFIFYTMQYTISNLNAFVIVITIGYSMYPFVKNTSLKAEDNNQPDRNYSPVQLISELKGYFYVNPVLALSLGITLFSFVGIPPLIGFFAKQMVLSAALDSGFVFIALIAILTSVISAAYYLSVIKQVFFDKNEYELSNESLNVTYKCNIIPSISAYLKHNTKEINYIKFKIENVILSGFLTITISTLTLILLLFMFASNE